MIDKTTIDETLLDFSTWTDVNVRSANQFVFTFLPSWRDSPQDLWFLTRYEISFDIVL